MAIIIEGKTKCRLCSKEIQKGDETCAFSSFVSNQSDPLFFYNDSAFHKHCAETGPSFQQALEQQSIWRQKYSSKICDLCGNEITDPDNFFALGLLSSEHEELKNFNFFQAHRSCLRIHSKGRTLADLLRTAATEGHFRNPHLELTLKYLESCQ